MKRELYKISRGDLCSAVNPEVGLEVSSVSKPISNLMSRVQGAELVSEQRGRIGDEYSAVYFVSPEAVAVKFTAAISVGIECFGATDDSVRAAYKKIDGALYAKKPQ